VIRPALLFISLAVMCLACFAREIQSRPKTAHKPTHLALGTKKRMATSHAPAGQANVKPRNRAELARLEHKKVLYRKRTAARRHSSTTRNTFTSTESETRRQRSAAYQFQPRQSMGTKQTSRRPR